MQVVIRKASILAVGCCFMLLLTQSCCSEEAREPERRRPAAHAGRFYPADPQRLTAMLAGMLEQAGDERRRRPLAVIVPHAGYVYSGQTAARAYRLLQGSAVKRIILLAPSHYASVKGIVINAQAYETPLGVYRLDRQALELLQRQPFPGAVSRIAGSQEHSDEVQIPFLQSVLPDARLVPLIVGDLTEAQLGQAARAVQAIIDEQTVIVASSDFTHYGPNYGYRPALAGGASDGIRALDDGAFATIVNCDRRAFQRYLDRTGITICGARPITLLLEVLSVAVDGPQGALLHYATSAELTGDWSNSVSYAAIVFNKKAPPAAQESTGHSGRLQNPARPMVDVAAQQSLLTLARHVLERFVRDEQKTFRDAELPAFESGASLQHPRGAFVTLKKKGKLRGCIGYVEGVRPLYRAVVENTINAACDSRFPHRVTPDELRDIVIEISVMTPLARVADLKEIEIGRDGLVLRKGGSGSLLLPQVPLEFGWDIEAYLLNLSRKAGLAADVYRELGRGVELYRFSAQVFSEKG